MDLEEAYRHHAVRRLRRRDLLLRAILAAGRGRIHDARQIPLSGVVGKSRGFVQRATTATLGAA